MKRDSEEEKEKVEERRMKEEDVDRGPSEKMFPGVI